MRPGSPELKAAFEAEMEAWRKDGRIRQLWAGDKALWTGTDEDKWLGWLRVVESERADLARLQAFAKEVKQRGFTDVALLGMGGSSLGPEVLAETFGNQSGWPRFHMLDSTDPAQIKTLEKAMDIAKTLFIVSSKSGGTLEPNIFMNYFLDRVRAVRGKDKAGENFVAVTDPGSSLEQARQGAAASPTSSMACPRSAAATRCCPSSAWCRRRRWASTSSGFSRRPNRWNGPAAPTCRRRKIPGVQLGVAMGVAATKFGRDKVTIIASPGNRRSRRLAGAASGREHGQARPWPDPADRRAARRARPLRQGPVLRLSRAGR